jgi:glycosyltransferase involved in cell wall biosynthesis
MNTYPVFSVLIANYNNETFLDNCLASIYEQTYTNWEVIFVDDCSNDNFLQIIGKYTAKDDRIKVFVNETNKGCGFTKAKCIQLASGEICGFLDGDDALMPAALEIMVEKHLENPDASLIYSRRFHCDRKLTIRDVSDDDTGKFISQLATPLISHFATFKKNFYDKTDGIDIYMKRAVDQDLYLKMEEQGKIIFVPQALYLYRHSSNSISLNSNEYKAQAWHIYANSNACKRRLFSLDDYCDTLKLGKNKIFLLAAYSFLQNIKNSNKIRKKVRFALEQYNQITKASNEH